MVAELLALVLTVAPPPAVAAQPKPSPAAKWRAPVPDEAKTASGIRVAVVPRADLPLVNLTVVIQAGSELDPPAQPGLAAAVSLLMEEGGAGALSGPELLAAIDALGGELEVRTTRSFTTLSLSVLAKHAERALSLLADMVARPRLDAAAWPRVKAHRLAEILERRAEPRFAADDLFTSVLLAGSPYAHAPLGTATSLEAMTAEQLKAFWSERYGPKTVAVFADGQTTAALLAKQAEAAFKGFSGAAATPKLAAPPVARARWLLVDRPGAPQTTVRLGHLGLARGAAEYGAAIVANTVLGGSFTSRLVQNLREAHGYTYGAFSQLASVRSGGLFVVRTEVRSDVTGPALAELLKELNGIVTPLSDAEASKGRALVTSDFVEALGSGSAGHYYGELLGLDVPTDALARLTDQLEAAQGEALAQVQKRVFRPGELVVVLVGDRKAIEPQLKGVAGALALEHVDLDGNPVP
ncbi:MAG: insulinase family protein [Archangiaceae bacterium]|nr:insulinase family protein [Archangiaceae bacterium]